MSETVRRGFVPTDQKEFSGKKLEALREAGKDLLYLINRGYKIKGASTLVGNHYMLSERQRMALVRGLATDAIILNQCQSWVRLASFPLLKKCNNQIM